MEAQFERTTLTRVVRGAIVLVSALWGALAGLIVTMGIVVAESRVGIYIFALHDLATFRLDTLPIPAGAILGVVLGIRRPGVVDRATPRGLAGLATGVLAGIPLGGLLWGGDTGRWAGAIVFGAAGLLAGGLTALRPFQRRPPPLRAGVMGSLLLLMPALAASVVITNLIPVEPFDVPEVEVFTEPDPADVDAVVFLLGDAGATEQRRSPLLPVLRHDVERWSAALARDSAVSIVYLGDLVYPEGVRNRAEPGFASDSSRLWNEIRLVAGPAAMMHRSAGLFVTGNHDWGNASGETGLRRVLNLAEQLDSARASGLHVTLLPPAGEPGPVARDLRHNVRILFLDTHWFLQARSPDERVAFFDDLEAMLESARDREVIIVAHHPYRSAGPHGAILPGYHAGGVAYLLAEAGALVQDLNSPAYDALRSGMRIRFESAGKVPLVFAGGHDHSLQVMTGEAGDPAWSLVSGAGSNLSTVRNAEGIAWGASRPGYMKLVFRKDDGVDLFVVAGDAGDRLCPAPEPDRTACMARGIAAFHIAFAVNLLAPRIDQVAGQRSR